MRNIFIVIKQEIVTTVGKLSFWIMTFLFPLLILGMNVGVQIATNRSIEERESRQPSVGDLSAAAGDLLGETTPAAEAAPSLPTIGYVDEAGIIVGLPTAVPPTLFRAYPDEAAAQAALANGTIEQYFLIPADYLANGEFILVEREFSPFGRGNDALFDYILTYNLTGDEALAMTLLNPTALMERRPLVPATASNNNTSGDSALAFAIPFATMFIFFFLLINSSGYMLQSVSREKENRTVEVLLVSLSPRDLMIGKMLGLSLVALLQMAIWIGSPLLLLGRGQELLNMAEAVTLPSGFLLWTLIYFLLGYLMYASMMGAIGALAPTAREGGQFVFIILLPLMLPLWFNGAFIESPNGALATALSLFPLTAPTAMMTRLAVNSVPTWQVAVSLGGLVITAYLLILLAARFFRADTLLSNAAIEWRRVWAAAR
jgi:ABC-2 type transport system permease protein